VHKVQKYRACRSGSCVLLVVIVMWHIDTSLGGILCMSMSMSMRARAEPVVAYCLYIMGSLWSLVFGLLSLSFVVRGVVIGFWLYKL
jgi:hypothetical protein